MYTGTRPWVTPAIRAGKGWRGRRELAPRCSATQLDACAVRSYRQRHVRYMKPRTTTTTTFSRLNWRSRLEQVCVAFLCGPQGESSC